MYLALFFFFFFDIVLVTYQFLTYCFILELNLSHIFFLIFSSFVISDFFSYDHRNLQVSRVPDYRVGTYVKAKPNDLVEANFGKMRNFQKIESSDEYTHGLIMSLYYAFFSR